MGKRGPKPDPKALRVFKGDPGHRKRARHDGEVEPPALAGAPDAPDWIGDARVGRVAAEVWAELAPHLQAVDLLRAIDTGALASYCVWQGVFRVALSELSDQMTLATETTVKVNPTLQAMGMAQKWIKEYGAQFGMSPASRVGLKTEPAAEANDMDEYKIGG